MSPTKLNIFVAIVTYNPDSRLSESLTVIKNIFSNIVIIDNNSLSDVLISDKDIHLVKNSVNLGIAQALNIAAEYAISQGARWLLMLDQDSIPSPDILSIYSSVYSSYPDKEKIAQIGVSFAPGKNIKRHWYNVSTLITSGTILSLEVYKIVGRFRSDFFIDSVDFEYSLRIRKKGFVNLLSPEVAIDHRLGSVKRINCFLFNIKSTNHSPQRRYYMARNNILISLEYFYFFPFWVLKKNFFFLKSFLEIITVDDQKIAKLKKTFSGIKDGFSYKSNEL